VPGVGGAGAGDGVKQKQIPGGNDNKEGRGYGRSKKARLTAEAERHGQRRLRELGALGTGYGGAGFFVAFAGSLGGSLVPILFALGEG
jgi:hypothetical protein